MSSRGACAGIGAARSGREGGGGHLYRQGGHVPPSELTGEALALLVTAPGGLRSGGARAGRLVRQRGPAASAACN